MSEQDLTGGSDVNIRGKVANKLDEIENVAVNKYFRGDDKEFRIPDIRVKRKFSQVKGTELRKELVHAEDDMKNAIISAARAEILNPVSFDSTSRFLETEKKEESTYAMSQKDLIGQIDLNTRAKLLDLRFDEGGNIYGPYKVNYTNNGRYLAFGGRNTGHLCVMDSLRNTPNFELFLKDSVKSLTFLHSYHYLAVAQKHHLFIYGKSGEEIHRLKRHHDPLHLEFLKYHFLLACASKSGHLVYQDTSTGDFVSKLFSKTGAPLGMAQCKSNAIVGLAHKNGAVSLWTPNQKTPVIEAFCHGGGTNDLTFDLSGNYLVTCGRNGAVSFRDMRKNLENVNGFKLPRPISQLEMSDSNLLAMNSGNVVKICKDWENGNGVFFYMKEEMFGKQISSLKFRPFEDILCLGHDLGVKTMIVPGAGLSNFDTRESNPFETDAQLREREVQNVLEKLRPEMITLNPSRVGQLSKKAGMELDEANEKGIEDSDPESSSSSGSEGSDNEDSESEDEKTPKKKRKMRGKGKLGRRNAAKELTRGHQERDMLMKKMAASKRKEDSE